MITRWKINNFKSILAADLPIAPLTIFAGANSGGKSTLLQSILLISQTLSYKIGSRSVVLNGPLIKLGQFDDLKTYGSTDSNITLGFECKPPDISMDDESLKYDWISFPAGYYRIDNILCEFSFNTRTKSVKDNLIKTQPKLNDTSIQVSSNVNKDTYHVNSINIKRSRSIKLKIDKLVDCVEKDKVNLIDVRSLRNNVNNPADYVKKDQDIIMESMNFDVKVDKRFKNYLSDKWKNYELMGCSTNHFLPDKLYLRVDKKLEDARLILKLFNKGDNDLRFLYVVKFGKEKMTIPAELVRLLDTILAINVYNLLDVNDVNLRENNVVKLLDYFELFHNLPVKIKKNARNMIRSDQDQDNVINYIYDCLKEEAGGKDSYRIETSKTIDEIRDAVDYIDSYFSAKVKYLGPLRDDPKPLYPITNNSSPFDIGIKGEFTASVMDIFKKSKVNFISPKHFSDAKISKEIESVSLEIAVSEWLRYFEIAHNTSSKDLGKLGHELKVTLSPQGQGHDLTHVGVGVSQVLPILVMCLISKKDDLIILEQPELHLHPKVQTRLADFFLSVMLTGKQCIIETHSEYLINRIRYRAATERDGNKVTDNLRLYFTNKIDNKTVFNNVTVNEYGAILDWPDGFFDQSQREAEEILREALRKKQEIRKGFKK